MRALLIPLVVGTLLAASCQCGHDPGGDDGGQDAGPDASLVWPNADSSANSDPWLMANHQAIAQLRPKVLLVNFVNGFTDAQATAKFQEIAAAYREATRPHGAGAPSIDFQLAKVVNLRDNPVPGGYTFENSTRFPRTSTSAPFTWMDYSAFFNATFAGYYGYAGADGGALTLCELIDRGQVNELWMIGSGDVPDSAAYESLEAKQRYTAANAKIAGSFDRCAGNGCFDTSVPICGRSVRIAFINYNRGVGCFLESLGHSFEGMSNNGSIPYLTPYFRELGMFDLNTRYSLPYPSWYPCSTANCLTFSDITATRMRLDWSINTFSGTIPDYLPTCGNAHFPPNGRANYDTVNPQSVPSTCAHFRMRDAPDGGDLIEMYSAATVSRYETLAPDCTGTWQVYWRQNFPGPGNTAKANNGQPMLNWWPFLYY